MGGSGILVSHKRTVGLLAAIRSAKPLLSLRAAAVVEAVLLVEGSIGSAESVARSLGLSNRFSLARLLGEAGLPPLHQLADWASVISWVRFAEQHGASLNRIASHSQRHASACYRLVRDVTGLTWSEAKAHGSLWLERQFVRYLSSVKNRTALTRASSHV